MAKDLFREKDGAVRPMDHDTKKYTKGTKAIRKELAILISRRKSLNRGVEDHIIVEQCRQEINTKYGKGWREQI